MTALFVLLAACNGPSSPPPNGAVEPTPPTPAPPNADVVGAFTIRPLYHGSVAIDVGGKTFVFDPVSSAPLGGVHADVVLVTHTHGDHLDPKAIAAIRDADTVVIAGTAVAEQTDVDTVLQDGQSTDVAGAHITAVAMYNLVRGPTAGSLYHEKGVGHGWLIDVGSDRAYVAGDTECTDEMKALTDVDVAFLPMNLPYTMPPDEAAACAKAFAPAVLYPYHYSESDLSGVAAAVGPGIEVRLRDWYPGE